MKHKRLTDGYRDKTVMYIDGKKTMSYLEDLQLALNDAESLPGKYGYYYNIYRWHNLVRVYSKPSLTEFTERIVGISGLVSRSGEILCDEYVQASGNHTYPWNFSALRMPKRPTLSRDPRIIKARHGLGLP